MRELNHPKAAEFERLRQYPPWKLLMLLKWVLIHGEWHDSLTRPLKVGELGHLLNLTSEVFDCGRLPSGYDALHLFMRNMAYQQFWFQQKVSGAVLARQSHLFASLPDNHRFRAAFRDELGLDIPDFVDLAIALLPKILLTAEPPGFTRALFEPIDKVVRPGAVDAFLRALSCDAAGAHALALSKRVTEIDWELYERTPFQAKPIFLADIHYVPMSRELLARALEHFVFRFLRDLDPGKFMQAFGPIFERYVLRVLEYSRAQYKTEADLRAIFPEARVVDALVHDGDDSILIEAKGIEFPEIGMITHLPEIVRDRAKPSVLRAIDQAYSTVSATRGKKQLGIDLGPGRTYLLVTTMQDTYLGNGNDFFKMVGREELAQIQARYGGEELIPPERMYFVTVQDLELMAQLIRDGATTYSAVLRHAENDDAVGKTKKFLFQQHLAYHFKEEPKLPTYLKEELDRLFERWKARFPEME